MMVKIFSITIMLIVVCLRQVYRCFPPPLQRSETKAFIQITDLLYGYSSSFCCLSALTSSELFKRFFQLKGNLFVANNWFHIVAITSRDSARQVIIFRLESSGGSLVFT